MCSTLCLTIRRDRTFSCGRGVHGSHTQPSHAGFTCGDNSGSLCCEPGTFPCYEGNPQTGYCCPGDDHTVCGVAQDGSGICSASLSVKTFAAKGAAAQRCHQDRSPASHVHMTLTWLRTLLYHSQRIKPLCVLHMWCGRIGTSLALCRKSSALQSCESRSATRRGGIHMLTSDRAPRSFPLRRSSAAAAVPQAAAAGSQTASPEEAASAACKALGASCLRLLFNRHPPSAL